MVRAVPALSIAQPGCQADHAPVTCAGPSRARGSFPVNRSRVVADMAARWRSGTPSVLYAQRPRRSGNRDGDSGEALAIRTACALSVPTDADHGHVARRDRAEVPPVTPGGVSPYL